MHFYNTNGHLPPNGSDPVLPANRIAERGRHGFVWHTDLARDRFVPQAVWNEIDPSEQWKTDDGAGPARPMGDETSRQLTDPYPYPVSAEDIRLHAWLVERLMLLNYERYGLWPRIRRFLFGSRPIRWLILHTLGENNRLRKTRSDIRGVLGDRSMDEASFRTAQFRPY